MDKQSAVYTYNGILLCLKKEILTPATLQINLKDTMLNEVNQSQKDKWSVIPFTWGPINSQIHRYIKYDGGHQGLGGGEMGTEFQIYKMKKFWRWMEVMVTTLM